MKFYLLNTLIIFNIFSISTCAKNNFNLELYQKITLHNIKGRLDHFAIDTVGKRLFLSALGNNSLEIIDLNSGKLLYSIKGLSEPQGVAYIPKYNKIYVNNGGTGKCNIYDAHSYKLLSTINLESDADNIRYDRINNYLFIGYGNGGIAAIDVVNDKIIYKVSLSGHPESFILETHSPKIYVNVPTPNGNVVVIDRNKRKIINTWKIGDFSSNRNSNFTMCLDESNNRLFIGTFFPSKLKVIDTQTGDLVTEFNIPNDCDDMFYDKINRIIILSCGGGYINVFKQININNYQRVLDIKTAKKARTSFFSKKLGLYFLAVPKQDDREASIWVYKLIKNNY